jgi:hypothetical protein
VKNMLKTSLYTRYIRQIFLFLLIFLYKSFTRQTFSQVQYPMIFDLKKFHYFFDMFSNY